MSEHLVRDLRESADQKEHPDSDASTGDGKIHKLHVDEAVGVGAGEEGLGRNEGPGGPMNEATPFQDWQNWRRAEAEAGSPMTVAYEFAAVSRVASPQAMTKVEAQKPPKEAIRFSGFEKCAVGWRTVSL